MHTRTFETINSVTEIYLRELERIRSALVVQLAQVEAQILVCKDFADATVELPLPLDEPEPETKAGTQPLQAAPAEQLKPGEPEPGEGKDLKLIQNWERDGNGRPALKPEPALTHEDLKRLEAAIKG